MRISIFVSRYITIYFKTFPCLDKFSIDTILNAAHRFALDFHLCSITKGCTFWIKAKYKTVRINWLLLPSEFKLTQQVLSRVNFGTVEIQ